MAPNKKQRKKHGGSKPKGPAPRAKGRQSLSQPKCLCRLAGKVDLKHDFGTIDVLPSDSNTGFLSIAINDFRAFVERQQLELASVRARLWEGAKVIAEQKQAEAEAKRLEQAKEQAHLVEQARLRYEASILFAGFFSFKYGGTVEQRRNIGSWSTRQLIPPAIDASIPPTDTFSPCLTETPVAIVERPPTPDSARYDLRRPSVEIPAMSQRDTTGGVDAAIKDTIQQMFFMQQHISQFRNEKQEGLINQAEAVARSIGRLEDQVTRPDNPLHNVTVAPEIMDYVEDGRNPDIYTRDFVELVQRGNAVMNGKQKAFRDFSKIFAKALKDNFDGLDEEVDMIMDKTGLEEKNGVFVEKGLRNGNST